MDEWGDCQSLCFAAEPGRSPPNMAEGPPGSPFSAHPITINKSACAACALSLAASPVGVDASRAQFGFLQCRPHICILLGSGIGWRAPMGEHQMRSAAAIAYAASSALRGNILTSTSASGRCRTPDIVGPSG
ncbi:hypothetical protein VTO73DRAFT_592 [Trametes versicolor]